MKSDITIVVQGPLYKITKKACEYYAARGFDVIYSGWETCDINTHVIVNEIPEGRKTTEPGIKFNVWKKDPKDIWNRGNVYKQVVSTLSGAIASKRKYVLKIRSDLWIQGIHKFISDCLENCDKINSLNISWSKTLEASFSMSDLVFFSERDKLIEALSIIKNRLEDHTNSDIEAGFCYTRLGRYFNTSIKKRDIGPENQICETLTRIYDGTSQERIKDICQVSDLIIKHHYIHNFDNYNIKIDEEKREYLLRTRFYIKHVEDIR